MNWAQVTSIIILIASLLLGLSTSTNINYRVFHNVVAISLLIIVIYGIPNHLNRFTVKGPYNWISWLHIIIFSCLIYISLLALRKWNQTRNHNHNNNNSNQNHNNNNNNQNQPFPVRYKGNTYNISSFVPQHPGGSVINKARNKDLEVIWKENGVSWHNNNPRVQKKLAELILL